MACAGSRSTQHDNRGLALAVTYDGGDPQLLERMLPLVDYLEVAPDVIAETRRGVCRLRPDFVAEIQQAGARARILLHGVGLSIGSHEGWSASYLDLLDDCFSCFDVAWHSEHLGYTRVDGEDLGTMLTMPRTYAALEMICERVEAVQRRYRTPFLLENVVHLLPGPAGDFSPAQFLNQITARTGCGVLLDVYNLECDVHNHGFDLPGFLDELDPASVRELHLARGVMHRGFLVDVHSRPLAESTIALAGQVLERCSRVEAVTFEFLKEAIPSLGYETICAELERLRAALRIPDRVAA